GAAQMRGGGAATGAEAGGGGACGGMLGYAVKVKPETRNQNQEESPKYWFLVYALFQAPGADGVFVFDVDLVAGEDGVGVGAVGFEFDAGFFGVGFGV